MFNMLPFQEGMHIQYHGGVPVQLSYTLHALLIILAMEIISLGCKTFELMPGTSLPPPPPPQQLIGAGSAYHLFATEGSSPIMSVAAPQTLCNSCHCV